MAKRIVRWMIRRDTREVLDIDAERYGADAINEKELVYLLQQRNAIGMVIEDEDSDEIVGYMIYMLEKTSIRLERIAVKYDREGIGRQLIDRLKTKVNNEAKRIRLVWVVPENNLGAQLFARSMGFRCNRVSREAFEDFYGNPVDGYAFDWFKVLEAARA
jgi:ribosomal protein S18 acetylase RimI-like enzyme